MLYYIILFKDGSLKFYKNKHDLKTMPQNTRQFACSSNVTVQDLHSWANNGYTGLRAVREIEE